MGIDGRQAMQLTADETAEYSPSWFPTSDRVAFMSNRGKGRYGLWSIDIATRREQLLFEGPSSHGRPAASPAPGSLGELQLTPSVTSVAFSLIPPSGRRVMYVSRLDDFAPRPITDGTASVGYPAWSPDERQLAVEVKDGSSTHSPSSTCPTASCGLVKGAWPDLGEQLVARRRRELPPPCCAMGRGVCAGLP